MTDPLLTAGFRRSKFIPKCFYSGLLQRELSLTTTVARLPAAGGITNNFYSVQILSRAVNFTSLTLKSQISWRPVNLNVMSGEVIG